MNRGGEVVKVEVMVNRGGEVVKVEVVVNRGGEVVKVEVVKVVEVEVMVEVVVLASEHCDCMIHSCNNNFFLLIQFVAIVLLVL